MNYLIFGGSGFIGTHLVSFILEQDASAVIYNLDIKESNHNNKTIFIYCDVRKEIKIDIPISENDIIFNLAAVHRTPGHANYEYFETNIYGAENVCAFSNKHNIKKIVFTSSISPYGASEDLKEETTLATPNTAYGISKLTAEKIHEIWQAGNANRALLILRPGVVFGKGENGNFTRLYWGIRKRFFFYVGRKNTVKACIYVKELVRFMFYFINKQQSGTELFNCTFYPAYTIEQIVENIKEVTMLKRKTFKINYSLLIFAASIANIFGGRKFGIHPERVKKLLTSTNISGKKLASSGFHFKYSFKEALADWYNDNNNQYLR